MVTSAMLDPKRLSTLRARAALAGVQLHVFDDEDTLKVIFIVSRWAMTKQLESLDAVSDWLDRVIGRKVTE
jgi:hypothetical protein